MEHDPVNHPSHYTYGQIEVIEIIEALDLPFHDSSALKYLLRWRHKDGVQDLCKAKWYIERMILNAETDLAVEVTRNPKEELSGSRGLSGEDRSATRATLAGISDLPGTGENRSHSHRADLFDTDD